MELVEQFLDWVLGLLPGSPFVKYIDLIAGNPYLNMLNYFVPIGTFVAIGQAWLLAVGGYYLYSIILRWIRAVE